MIKMVAVDLDGTLLDNAKKITTKNIETIKKAKNKGIHIVMCSGRTFTGIEKYLDAIKVAGVNDYLICHNGAVVTTSENEVIFEKYFSGKDYKQLAAFGEQYNVAYEGYDNDGVFASRHGYYVDLDCAYNFVEPKIVDYKNIPDDMKITKLTYADEPKKLDVLQTNIPNWIKETYEVNRSLDIFLDINPKGIDKWVGIMALAKHLNIQEEEIMTIGDAGNDLQMVKNSKLGVAMANATCDIKEVSNFITKSNENSGVAYAIEKFVLGE